MDNRTIGIGLGAVTFVIGLLLQMLTYTKHIPPEKKKQVGLSAVGLMIVGATMAILSYTMKIAQQSPL